MSDASAQRRIHYVVWRVTGEDARTWLNGQVTNEVRGLEPGDAVYALILDTRGKILSDAWILERGSEVLLLVPERVSAEVRAHLEEHIIMEDVALEPLDTPVSWVGGVGGRPVLGDGPTIDDAAWKLERVRAGVPELGADFGREHYPQEAGLKRAVSFEKGCYLGQEVVCMLENRGQLSRRLVQLTGSKAIEGAALIHEGKNVGSITSAVEDGARAIALGYVKRAVASPGTKVESDGGPLEIVAIVGESTPGLGEASAL